jgi:hypothetical protein
MLCLRPLLLETQLHWQASVAAIPLRDVEGDTALRKEAMQDWLAELHKAIRDQLKTAQAPKGLTFRVNLSDLADGTLVLKTSITLGSTTVDGEKSLAGPADAQPALDAIPAIARELASLAGTLKAEKAP